MATKVGEVFIDLAVDAASGNLSVRQLVSALGDLDVASVGSTAALAKVGDVIWNLSKSAMNTAVELSALAELTGIDPVVAQQWEDAAAQIVGHAGSITNAIKAIAEMNMKISAPGGGTPAVLSQLLGMTPYKENGKLKSAMDYMKEMSAAGSQYRKLSFDQQREATREMFGGAGDDAFRLINRMMVGKFHPESHLGLTAKQITDLNALHGQETRFGQQTEGIFQKLLTAGGVLTDALISLNKTLDTLNKLMATKQFGASMRSVYGAWGNAIKNNPIAMGMHAGADSGRTIGGLISPLLSHSLGFSKQQDMLRGKLDLNMTMNGKYAGTATAWLDKSGTMRDVWNATDHMGNTP